MFFDTVALSYLLLLLFPSSTVAFFPIAQVGDGIRHTAGSIGGHFHHGSTTRDVLKKRGDLSQNGPNIFISIAPFRSATRYQVRSAVPLPSRTLPLDKRTNQYKIVTANQPSQPTSLAVDQDGTDYSYFSEMEIGSKATKMFMLLDTGSAVTWVMSDTCKSGPCAIHNTFGTSSGSDTLKVDSSRWKLDYGSGEVSGVNANDTISFAGVKVTVPIGLADDVSKDFQNYPFDGILGLGRIPIQNQPAVTFLQGIANNKLLPATIFGVNLQRNADGSADGEINFGSPDKTKYQGDLHWIDTISDHSFWELGADDITVDGESVGLNKGRTAILDTGTSYMLIPPEDAKAVFSKIPGATTSDKQNWYVPCDSKAAVQVVIGGVGYTISPKDYVGAQTGKRDNACVSHIVGLAAGGDNTWLLGDTFLKNVYTVFDAEKNRVGFGAKSGSSVVNQDQSSTATSASSSASGSSTASGSSARPSVTGGLGLPGASSSKSGDAATPSTSPGSAASTSDTKKSAGSSIDVGKAIILTLTGVLSMLLV